MSESTEDPDDAVIQIVVFVTMSLVFAGLLEALPEWVLHLFPQSVLVLVGLLVAGLIGIAVDNDSSESRMEQLISMLEQIPEGLQLIFLPPLIFSELFKTNAHVFLQFLVPSLFLAFPGVLIGMVLTALFPVYILPSSWSWYEALAFGGMLSATDPVAVIALLHELGASKRLSSIISGESVLNDGSAIVVVTLFLDLQAGVSYDAGEIVAFIFREVLGSLCLGFAFGIVLLAFIPLLNKQPTPLVALTFAFPYLTFASAMVGGMSGVLALVPLGLMANIFGKATIVGTVAERMEHFWNQAEFIANTVLFAISGLFIAADLMSGKVQAQDWGYLVLLYILVIAIRFVTIALLYPLLKWSGEGITMADATVMWWGGLRGAVGLTLSFVIRSSANVSESVGDLTTFFMGGIVALTLFVNAPSAGPLVRKLKLQHDPDKNILRELFTQFKEIAASSLIFAGGNAITVDKLLRGAHSSFLSESSFNQPSASSNSNNQGEQESTRSSQLLGSSHNAASRTKTFGVIEKSQTLPEKRRHFLLAQSVTYNRLLDRKLIGRSAWYLLQQSIDSELDKRDSALDQWNKVFRRPVVRFMLSRLRGSKLESNRVLANVLSQHSTSDTVEAAATEEQVELELGAIRSNVNEEHTSQAQKACECRDPQSTKGNACCLSCKSCQEAFFCCTTNVGTVSVRILTETAYAYLRAHQISRASVSVFQSEQDGLKEHRLQLFKESIQACEAPARFLNAVKLHRPDVLKDLKARQLLSAIKFELLDKVFELGDLGLLEETEIPALIELTESICSAAEGIELDLIATKPFDSAGNFELNEDLYPFFSNRHMVEDILRIKTNKVVATASDSEQGDEKEPLETDQEQQTGTKQSQESAQVQNEHHPNEEEISGDDGKSTSSEPLEEETEQEEVNRAAQLLMDFVSSRSLADRVVESNKKYWYN